MEEVWSSILHSSTSKAQVNDLGLLHFRIAIARVSCGLGYAPRTFGDIWGVGVEYSVVRR